MPQALALIPVILGAVSGVASLVGGSPSAPKMPTIPTTPAASALSTAQMASLASPYAAQAQSQFGGALSPQALMQWIESLMRQQQSPELTGSPTFMSGLQQVVNQTFGSTFQPGLTSTGLSLT